MNAVDGEVDQPQFRIQSFLFFKLVKDFVVKGIQELLEVVTETKLALRKGNNQEKVKQLFVLSGPGTP